MSIISIIIPVFNVEKHIEKSIDSIFNQTIYTDDIEVILVDDCSTDNSGLIIDEYALKYENFRAIHLDENSGAAGKPRNVGLNIASSDFVMFLDSDDCFMDNALEVLLNKIKDDEELNIVLGGYVNIHGEKRETVLPFRGNENTYFEDTQNELDLVEINPAISSKIFRKDFLIENNITFPEGIPGQDLVFFLNSFFHSNKVLSLSNFIVYKRILRSDVSDKSMSFNLNYNYIIGLIKAYTLTLDVFKENNVNINLAKLILIIHLRFLTNQLLKNHLTKDEISRICNSNEFHNFINNDFFNVATEFRLIFSNMEKDNFDNIGLIDYIRDNIEKEIRYQYENIGVLLDNLKIENKKLLSLVHVKDADNFYLKNKNKELYLELKEVHNSKLWKLKNILK